MIDVAVVGGGPAGATAATLLARSGMKVACFERERFPRFHVGESLLPATMPLFDRLGVRSRLAAAGYLRKYGATFIDDVEGRRLTFSFRSGPSWADHAYNVPRGEFDRLLLDQAIEEGAAVHEGARVETVAVDRQGVDLTVTQGAGPPRAMRARFLVDASGREALVATASGRREPRPGLGKVALFAHFAGVARWAGRLEGHIRIHLFPHGWFWWIPFAGAMASVGCVLHQRVVRSRAGSVEELFEEMLAASPGVAEGLRDARRVTPVHRLANFSYRTSPGFGPRWIAVGDAVTFVDPIFSTGVYVAMQSAVLTADTLVTAWDRPGLEDALGDLQQRLVPGTQLFFEFIERFYDPAFLDVLFSPSPPPVLGTLGRRALTTMLAGGAFLRQAMAVRLGLAILRAATRITRRERRRRGLPVESRFRW